MSCSSNTLIINRPSNPSNAGAGCTNNSAVLARSVSCTDGGSCGLLGPVDRKIGKRKNREKVREQLKDYIMLSLGAPSVKLEFNSQQLDMFVDVAMQEAEDYAGDEFYDYYVFSTVAGKSVYKMPDDVGIIKNVYYKEQGTFAFQASDLDGAIPVEYFYPGGAYASIQGGLIDPLQPIWGRAGEWVLYKQYEQMYSRLSSNIGGFEFVGDTGYVKLYPTPCKCSRVAVRYVQKCKDWKEAYTVLRDGALAEAMITLGHIRGKFTNIPGPSGGVQLDGDYMRTKGWELKEKWRENLIQRYGGLLEITMG